MRLLNSILCVVLCLLPSATEAQDVTVLGGNALSGTVIDPQPPQGQARDTALIGGDTVIVVKSGAAVVIERDLPQANRTIETTCARDFFARRFGNPNLISLVCWGGLGGEHLRSQRAIEEYLGGFRAGGMSSLAFDTDEIGLYSELASDNFYVMKGYARIGFGALVSGAAGSEGEADPDDDDDSDSEDDEAGTSINQFYQGGGNAIAYLAFPAFHARNYIQTFQTQPHLTRKLDLFLTLIAGADVPAVGETVQDRAMNARLGFQGTLIQVTAADVFNLFVHADGGLGAGSSEFFTNLGVADKDHPWFWVGQLEAGIDIAQIIRAGVEVGWSSMSANLEPRVSIRLIPAGGRPATRGGE